MTPLQKAKRPPCGLSVFDALRSSSPEARSRHGCPRIGPFREKRLEPSVVVVITVIIVSASHEIDDQHGARLQLVELEARLQYIGDIKNTTSDIQADVVILERKADQAEVLVVNVFNLL
ncbi:hypothetical protein PG994_005802 [Apiospora phragmitis]|uniref:Uncharacterized protein n=1 Tax=Apiospora phragmitis TaxID=2905665 RepID=A0ABR1VFT8_9PEZI